MVWLGGSAARLVGGRHAGDFRGAHREPASGDGEAIDGAPECRARGGVRPEFSRTEEPFHSVRAHRRQGDPDRVSRGGR